MEASGSVANGIGQPVRRKEDARLLTGKGRFGDDVSLPGMAHAVIVRSPHAHARIVSVDKRAALAAPGVLAVLTGVDYLAAGLGLIPHNPGLSAPPDVQARLCGGPPIATRHYPLPVDRVRFVGEPVALVVAESIAEAKDAAELLDITYEPLPAVLRAMDAVMPEAALLWEEAPDNICIDIEVGDASATADAFAGATHIVRLETWAQRVTGVPMEPRTNVAEYDVSSGRYTIHTGSGRGVAKVRTDLAQILGVPTEQVRCVCGDMGGNFGTRNLFYPEYALLAWASRRLMRPVKWTCERSDSFLSDWQGRDLTVEAELALDAEGHFLAVRGSNLSNLGGHAVAFGPLQKGLGLMSSVYRIPVGYFRGRGAVTNTVSTTPYRSSGRPEAIFVIERLTDLAADELGLDPVQLRRRNMIPPTAQPYANPLGLTYDNGRYEEAMDTALALADWDGFSGRRAESRRRGKWRGIGIANYIEITSGAPRERTEITVLPEGKVELVMGTMSSGQGHETSFAQLVTEWLGVPFDSIVYVAHDTDRVSAGGGSHSGRSMKLATTIIGQATDDIIDKGRKIASFLFEAGEVDIEFERGHFRVAGTDLENAHLAVGAGEIARAARRHLRPDVAGRELPVRYANLRGRRRCRNGCRRDRRLHRGRRCRPRGQPADPAWSDAWRHRPGRRSGVARTQPLRPRERAAAGGELYGLRDAARRHLSALGHSTQRGAGTVEPPRCALRRRRRHDAGARRDDQRHRQRARRVRRAPHRNAGHTRAGMARDPGRPRRHRRLIGTGACRAILGGPRGW